MKKTKAPFVKVSIFVVAIVAAIGLFAWFAQPQDSPVGEEQEAPQEESLLEAQAATFDFGTISMAAGVVYHVFRVTNPTNEALVISRTYTSCMCTEVALREGDEMMGPFGMQGHGFIPRINHRLEHGEGVDVEVTFDPAAHGPSGIGYVERTVTLEMKQGGPLLLTVSATVTP